MVLRKPKFIKGKLGGTERPDRNYVDQRSFGCLKPKVCTNRRGYTRTSVSCVSTSSFFHSRASHSFLLCCVSLRIELTRLPASRTQKSHTALSGRPTPWHNTSRDVPPEQHELQYTVVAYPTWPYLTLHYSAGHCRTNPTIPYNTSP